MAGTTRQDAGEWRPSRRGDEARWMRPEARRRGWNDEPGRRGAEADRESAAAAGEAGNERDKFLAGDSPKGYPSSLPAFSALLALLDIKKRHYLFFLRLEERRDCRAPGRFFPALARFSQRESTKSLPCAMLSDRPTYGRHYRLGSPPRPGEASNPFTFRWKAQAVFLPYHGLPVGPSGIIIVLREFRLEALLDPRACKRLYQACVCLSVPRRRVNVAAPDAALVVAIAPVATAAEKPLLRLVPGLHW